MAEREHAEAREEVADPFGAGRAPVTLARELALASAIGNRAMARLARDPRLLARRLLQREWIDDQVEAVRGPLSRGDEPDAINALNVLSLGDMQKVIKQLSDAHRKRLKEILHDFIGKADVDRIRTAIALVEGGGSAEVNALTEKAHDLIRARKWAEAYRLLLVDGDAAVRSGALARLSSGHLKAMLEYAPLWGVDVKDEATLQKGKNTLLKEAYARSGFGADAGREFKNGKAQDTSYKTTTPSTNVAAMLIEGCERFIVHLNAYHDDPTDFVGHAWIAVVELEWPFRRFSFGFWPGAGKKEMLAGGKGRLFSPDPHDGQQLTTRSQFGDRDTIKRLQTIVAAYEGRDYDLFGDNCAKFATRAWKAMTGEDQTGDDWWFSSPGDIMDRGSALIPDKT